jgi:GTPase SAR1 family protein
MVFTLQITDTTGSHQFPAMQRLNIQKGHAFILVYSIVNRQSLEELKPIFRDIIDIKSAQQSDKQYLHIPMILIGSKCDEAASRTVPTALGEKLAQDYNCAFMEVIKMN